MTFRARLLRGLVVASGLLTAGVFGLAWGVYRYGRRERARSARAIVVLGAKVWPGGVPSDALVSRVEKAVELFQAGVAPLLLFTGGEGPHPPAEALLARQLALARGVPPEACLLEVESRTTSENARHAARLLKERGALPAVLVSDPFHLLRAQRLFRLQGAQVLPSPAWGWWRRMSRLDRFYWTCREAFALLLQPRLWRPGPPFARG